MKRIGMRISAAALSAVMLCGAFTACGKSDKKKADADGEKKTVVKPTVIFSKEAGCYDAEFSLGMSLGEDIKEGEIYYTLDGSDPSESSTAVKYEAELSVTDRKGSANVVSAVDPALFDNANVKVNSTRDGFDHTMQAPSDDAVDKCTVVKAAVKNGDEWTACETATYFIGKMDEHIKGLAESCEAAGTSLAVISLSVDYDDLFDAEKGIYVSGNIFTKAVEDHIAAGNWLEPDTARRLQANYSQRGRDWERKAGMNMFEVNTDGAVKVLSQNCGIRIQGNYSRSDLQKGFRLYARKDYGNSSFNYSVFGEDFKNDSGETMDEFKVLTLRAGGNCAFTTKYSDTYWQTLIEDMNVETQKSRPCVVYLDGEYWGLYVLQEDYTDDYFEQTHGVNKDDVIVYKGDAETYAIGYKLDEGELPEGEKDQSYYFKELKDFFRTHKNASSDEDYKELASIVDPDSVMDYFAVEVWVNNKWDWPGKNWSMWKTMNVDESNPYADGRWRLCVYDIEFGGVSGKGDAYTNTIKDDNYKPNGLLDMGTTNPAVLSFAYLMTNEGFRNDFYARLSGLGEGNFEKQRALDQLEKINGEYSPLYDQFFDRYPESGSAEDSVNGGYASKKCIEEFLEIRADHIQPMIDYCERILA